MTDHNRSNRFFYRLRRPERNTSCLVRQTKKYRGCLVLLESILKELDGNSLVSPRYTLCYLFTVNQCHIYCHKSLDGSDSSTPPLPILPSPSYLFGHRGATLLTPAVIRYMVTNNNFTVAVC
jgi:hypothetical protein